MESNIIFEDVYPAELSEKVAPIQKLYYKTTPILGFPFKVQFVCNGNAMVSDFQLTPNPPFTVVELKKCMMGLDHWLRKIYKQKYEWPANLKDVWGQRHRTIYLQDYDHFNTVLEKYGKYVKLAERPINQEHYDMLYEGGKLLFRQKYFWGQYRYKVGFKSTDAFYTDHTPWLFSFFEDRLASDYKFNSAFTRTHIKSSAIYPGFTNARHTFGRKTNGYYYGYNLFLESKEDVMMVKLKIGKDIHFVEKIIKHDEISNVVTPISDYKKII